MEKNNKNTGKQKQSGNIGKLAESVSIGLQLHVDNQLFQGQTLHPTEHPFLHEPKGTALAPCQQQWNMQIKGKW